MSAVARKQAVRRSGDRVRTIVVTEVDRGDVLDELDSLGKAGSVAKLVFERRVLRSDDGVSVVRGIGQFRHGDAEQPVEAGRLK